MGAPFEDHGEANTPGSAYILVRSGETWTEQARLVASDAADGDVFGWSVALDGETALVGAGLDDLASGTDAGSAYVFVRSGETWTEQAQLVASDGDTQGLGVAVALAGDTALVGANVEPFGLNGVNGAGRAYVYVRSGATWTEQAKLIGSDAAWPDGFGSSVALAGDTAVVGASGRGSDAGNAYVFERSHATWAEHTKLVSSDDSVYRFGYAVAVAGDTALVGGRGADLGMHVAHVFVLEDKLEVGAPCGDGGACVRGSCTDGVCDDPGSGGCSCRVTGAPVESGAPRELGWIALAGLVMAARLRRRRAP